MSNKDIYKKTLVFSVRSLLMSLISLTLFAGLCVGGYAIAEKTNDMGLVGLGIGAVIAVVIIIILAHFFGYAFKAAQIAMMTKAVTEDQLPDDVYHEGMRVVKERFTTVAAYYLATSLIKGIFRQIGNLITKAGQAIGGDAGDTIGGIISTVIQVLIGFLCDCCLGWVFYRSDLASTKATCEGAVIFFKNGKTLLRNMGRIFGMGIVSLLVIGGAFTGIFYMIATRFGTAFDKLAAEIIEMGQRQNVDIPAFFQNAENLALIAGAVAGVILWEIIHSTFVRPFILAGVLRNYMKAGIENMPTANDFNMLDSKSPKFAKLHREIG